jgi:glycerol-3-phosphate dehydrogenase (NAD(P)+)
MSPPRIAIIGAGGWGTALAKMWAELGFDLILWARDRGFVEQLQTTRKNERYLPGIDLPRQICLTSDPNSVREATLVVFVTPSTALRAIAEQMRLSILPNATLLSCTKGIEHGSGLRMTEVLQEVFAKNPVAVLSGPNIAPEIARGQPAAAVLGCADTKIAHDLQSLLGSPRFRIYTSDDVTSIELGGALKNVFAIAAGVCDGLQLGDNAKAALITRSLAELIRLGSGMGGNPHTFYGLSGLGDLIVTCFSKRSRNRTVGERVARGETLDRIVADMHTVAEGIPTSESAFECARKIDIETPIIDQVYEIVHRRKSPAQALNDLLQREQKPELANSP